MIKDVDGLSRYVDPLVYQYIITACHLHTEDVTTRPFIYSVDFCIFYNNSYRVAASYPLTISITTSSVTIIRIVYHNPIKFSSIINLTSFPLISTLIIASYPFMLSLFQKHLDSI